MKKVISLIVLGASLNLGAQFSDIRPKQAADSHHIYQDGGENKHFRITENEKALNQLKKRLKDYSKLVKRVEALEEKVKLLEKKKSK
jgi:hypothetical protein